MKFVFVFLLIIASFGTLFSQSIDSIAKVNINKYYMLALNTLRATQWDKAISYADTMYYISKEGNSKGGVASALILKGEAYMNKGNYSMAYQCYNKTIEFIDSSQYEGGVKGRLYKDLFILFSIQNDQDSVQKYKDMVFNLPCEESTILAKDYVAKQLLDSNQPKEALLWASHNTTCAKELGAESIMIGSLHLISNIYREVDDYESAIFYVDSTLKMAQKLKDSLYIGGAYDQLGVINSKLKNHSKALEWFRESVKVIEQINNESGVYVHSNLVRTRIPMGAFYNHLAGAYQDVDRQNNTENYVDSVNLYHQKALEFSYRQKDTLYIASSLINIAKYVMRKEENYNIALDSLEKSYNISPRHVNWVSTQYHIHSTQGEIYTKLKEYNKAILYLDKAELAARTLKDTTTRLVKVYELQRELYVAKEDYKKAYTYEVKTRELNKVLEETQRQKTLIGFEIKYETEQVRQQNIVLAQERDIQKLEAKRSQQLIYAGVVLLVFIVIVFILLILQFRAKANFLTQKLKYQLLRNQMNPHFIFNSLTAIQSFVYKKNPIEAGEYIASFAELMRAILDNSHEEYVSLGKEIQWLENYLKLQLLRFSNQFDYTLKLDPQIDIDDMMIPPMLTQPFIENALEHGLKNLDYKGHLDINININVHDKSLAIDILDNGIGLEESKKNNQGKKHKSRATEITQERLMFLNKKQSKNINLSIEPNKGIGTKISFTIPFISKF